MGDRLSNTGNYKRFLLLVEQLNEETVARVGAIIVRSDIYVDEENIYFFDEEGLE